MESKQLVVRWDDDSAQYLIYLVTLNAEGEVRFSNPSHCGEPGSDWVKQIANHYNIDIPPVPEN